MKTSKLVVGVARIDFGMQRVLKASKDNQMGWCLKRAEGSPHYKGDDMQKTRIEWVKNPDGTQGYTLNPIKGKCPMACPYCYARAMYDRFKWDKTIRFDVEELLAIERHKEPSGIFLGSTFELFWDNLERFWQDSIFATIRACPQHHFYLLTKQPQNLIKFSPFPPNCWVGVTATNNTMFQRACHWLRLIDAKVKLVKFVSLEPLLAWDMRASEWMAGQLLFGDVSWLIIGAQTKPYKPPQKIWVDEITEACKRANIPYFLKDNLRPLMGNDLVQDMPKGVEIDH